MWDWMLAGYLRNYQVLSEKVAAATQEQWKFFSDQSRFGFALWNAMLGSFRSEATSSSPPKEQNPPGKSLEEVTAERLKEGLAPPREIYDIRNRGRIDWSRVPEWAKPVDPELFESGHEG